MTKLIDERGKRLFEFEIKIVCSPKKVVYLAKDKDECQSLFLENNEDLDVNDINITKIGKKAK